MAAGKATNAASKTLMLLPRAPSLHKFRDIAGHLHRLSASSSAGLRVLAECRRETVDALGSDQPMRKTVRPALQVVRAEGETFTHMVMRPRTRLVLPAHLPAELASAVGHDVTPVAQLSIDGIPLSHHHHKWKPGEAAAFMRATPAARTEHLANIPLKKTLAKRGSLAFLVGFTQNSPAGAFASVSEVIGQARRCAAAKFGPLAQWSFVGTQGVEMSEDEAAAAGAESATDPDLRQRCWGRALDIDLERGPDAGDFSSPDFEGEDQKLQLWQRALLGYKVMEADEWHVAAPEAPWQTRQPLYFGSTVGPVLRECYNIQVDSALVGGIWRCLHPAEQLRYWRLVGLHMTGNVGSVELPLEMTQRREKEVRAIRESLMPRSGYASGLDRIDVTVDSIKCSECGRNMVEGHAPRCSQSQLQKILRHETVTAPADNELDAFLSGSQSSGVLGLKWDDDETVRVADNSHEGGESDAEAHDFGDEDDVFGALFDKHNMGQDDAAVYQDSSDFEDELAP